VPVNLDEVRSRMSHFVPSDVVALVAEVEDLRLQVRALEVANERWAQTAWAAAEEIEEHWSAHADADGYGPVNLVRRLRGKPQNYGTPMEVAVAKAKDEERKRALDIIHAAIAQSTEAELIAALRALAEDVSGEPRVRRHAEG
jgi:hypothetical protein